MMNYGRMDLCWGLGSRRSSSSGAQSCWWILMLLVWLFDCSSPATIATAVTAKQHQKFVREPEDQTAVAGETVVLACRVMNKEGTLQWTKDDFGLGEDRDLSGFERYTAIGSDEEGQFSLQIKPVTLDDDGRYQCQVSPGPDAASPAIRSRYASLVVNNPPEAPQIVQGSHLVTTEDREVELECHSKGGKPASEINWLDGDGNLITDGIEVFKEVLPDGKRTNVKSVLKLVPGKEHHNKNISCVAQNAAERTPRVTGIQLHVKYAPKVTIHVGNEKIVEFDSVKVFCDADANPGNLTYKWFINDEVVHGDYTTRLTIASVTRKLNHAVVKCQVHNAVGKSEDTHTLDISYGPTMKERPLDVEADLGSTVTLRCDVDGSPQPEISWTYENSRRVLHVGSTFTFVMTPAMVGRFVCTARVPGFPEVSADSSVILKGPPTITTKRVQFGADGDTIRVECVAFAVPRPDRVFWSRAGLEVDSDDPRISILEDPLPDGVRSTLIIRNSQRNDFGSYNCTVYNSYGNDSVEIFLRVQNSVPLLIILAGIIGGVILVIVIILTIMLCKKKTKKCDDGLREDKQPKQPDQNSSNDSDLKVDIRTASSLSNGQESDHWEDGSDRITPRPVLTDFVDSTFPAKSETHNNNGYVPYTDYTRTYNPYTVNPSAATSHRLSAIDPRFSGVYNNSYLRNSTISLMNTPSIAASTYTAVRNGSTQFVTSTGNSKVQLKPGTLATHV